MIQIRINKYLASIGIASRRQIDNFIDQGEISINGNILSEKGIKIDPDTDIIKVNGKAVSRQAQEKEYIILNKPIGVLSTAKDTHGRQTVLDLIKSKSRLYPIGRLDQNSHGLIILTNDGDLTLKLTHPRNHISKVYLAKILGQVKEDKIRKMKDGVELEDGLTAPAKVETISQSQYQTVLQITLFEGKKRQIRHMCATLHLYLQDLQRIAIGPIKLGNLDQGEWRKLTKEEVKLLQK